MGSKRKRGGGGGEEQMRAENSYEAERNAMLEENRKRMLELGLLEDVSTLFGSTASPKAAKLMKRKLAQSPSDPSRRSATPTDSPVSSGPVRRSSRLQGTTTVRYTEQLEDEVVEKPRRSHLMEGSKPEIYTEEDVKKLGSYEKEWELFVDGCDGEGKRIYDPANGKTCHQCRQKTLGHRTSCSSCEALKGQFCGDCLFMRYGENVLETLKNKKWVCPICRGICNCSLCRPKQGWAPTGSLYRKAIALGYKSVAHYLILTRRAININ